MEINAKLCFEGDGDVTLAPHAILGFSDLSHAGLLTLICSVTQGNTVIHKVSCVLQSVDETKECGLIESLRCVSTPIYVKKEINGGITCVTHLDGDGMPEFTLVLLNCDIEEEVSSFLASEMVNLLQTNGVSKLTVLAGAHFLPHPSHPKSHFQLKDTILYHMPVFGSATVVNDVVALDSIPGLCLEDPFLSALCHIARISKFNSELFLALGKRCKYSKERLRRQANRVSMEDHQQTLGLLGSALSMISPLRYQEAMLSDVEIHQSKEPTKRSNIVEDSLMYM